MQGGMPSRESWERKGQAIRVPINLVNWQQEEPTGCGGGRQPSMDGTSRVTGDCHARFCERLGVQFPGATRRGQRVTAVPIATRFPTTFRPMAGKCRKAYTRPIPASKVERLLGKGASHEKLQTTGNSPCRAVDV